MNQRDFYNLPEVKTQLDIQKRNPWGSDAHRKAHNEIGKIAKKIGVWVD